MTSRAAFTTPADGPCSPHGVSGLEPGATSFDTPGAIPGIRRARIAAPYTFKAFAQSGANQSASNSASSQASNSSATGAHGKKCRGKKSQGKKAHR